MATISKDGDNGHFTYQLTVTQKSQDVANNQSTVSFTFKMINNSFNTYWTGFGSYMRYTVTINGTKYTYNIPNRSESQGLSDITLISEKTQKITHGSDGKKTINFSFSVIDETGYTWACGNASASGTLTLTTIARKSSFKINNKTSGVTVNVEDSVEIAITRQSTSFSHKIQCKAPYDLQNFSGSQKYSKGWITAKTLPKEDTKYSLKINPIWYNLFKSTTNPTLEIQVLTYSGSTLIGTSESQIITLKLNPEKTNPTVSKLEINYPGKNYYYGDANGKKVLQPGTSKVSGTYSYSYSDNYKAYRIYDNNGKSLKNQLANKTNITSDEITINSDTIKLVFTDQLGKSITYTKKNTEAVYYSKPSLKIGDLSYHYNEQDGGKYIITGGKCTITGSAFGCTNNKNLTINYLLTTDINANISGGSSVTIKIGEKGLNKNINQTIEFSNLNLDSIATPFYLKVSYKDEKTAQTDTTKNYKIQPLFDWDDNNFQFNIPVYINKSLIMPKDNAYSLANKTGGSLNMNNGDIFKANRVVFADYANGDVSEGLIFPREDNSNKFDCLRVRNRNIRVLPNYDGGTTIPAEDIYYPGHNGGDSVTFSNNSAQWAGHITGGSKLIYFTIPFNRPIITSTDKISISGQVVIRTIQGYGFVKEQGTTNAEINLTGSGVTTTVASRSGSGISVLIKATNPFQTSSGGELSNNRPLTIETAGLTVTFSK